jgi:hypothetical protein
MKHRVILSLVVFLGFCAFAQVRGQVAAKNPVVKPFQDTGRDVSQDGWSGWQAPVGTVDPSRMMSSDGVSNASAHFDSVKLASTLDHGKTVQMEKTKSIEEVAATTTTTDTVVEEPAVIATAAPKGGTRKILWVGVACVAFLAFRMFRRSGNLPKKPRYL